MKRYILIHSHSLSGSLKDVSMNMKHLETALEDHTPFGLHGISLKPPSDNRVTWNDVGGLNQVKKTLVETLKWPTQVVLVLDMSMLSRNAIIIIYNRF